MKFLDIAQGKKTYAVVVIGMGLGIAQHFGWHVPGWLDWVIGFAGMGTLRMAVQAQSAKSADDLDILARTVLQAITVPDPNKGLTGAAIKTVPVEQHELQPVTTFPNPLSGANQ